MITIKRRLHTDPDFQKFCKALDKEFWVRYGETLQGFEPFNRMDKSARVVLAYLSGTPVGCGCFRPMDETNAIEIKRMFVMPACRGQGIARIILEELERWAKSEGYITSKLETGIKQPEAIALYTRNGYKQIPNYAPYVGISESICMIKNLCG